MGVPVFRVLADRPDGFRELRLLAVTRRSANNLAKALDVF
jgi:hypothetical protein